MQHIAYTSCDSIPYVQRVVLNPARPWEALGEFSVRRGYLRPIATVQRSAATGSSLVYRKDAVQIVPPDARGSPNVDSRAILASDGRREQRAETTGSQCEENRHACATQSGQSAVAYEHVVRKVYSELTFHHAPCTIRPYSLVDTFGIAVARTTEEVNP